MRLQALQALAEESPQVRQAARLHARIAASPRMMALQQRVERLAGTVPPFRPEPGSEQAPVQRVPADFARFLQQKGFSYGMFESFSDWAYLVHAIKEKYTRLTPEEYEARKTLIGQMLGWAIAAEKDIAEKVVVPQPDAADLIRFGLIKDVQTQLLKEEASLQEEVKAVKGSLVPQGGSTNLVDPRITRKIEGAGAIVKDDVDVVDGKQARLGRVKKGTAVRRDITDTTLKGYDKIEPEDPTSAGANFQDFKPGYVPEHMLIQVKRVAPQKDLQYVDVRDPLRYPLFKKPPSLDDIKQGQLGDCYLLAAVAGIVRNDPTHFVDHMVDNLNGTVTVKLYSAPGQPVYYTVKKTLVVDKNNYLEFAASAGSFWVPILEKAYIAAGYFGTREEPLPAREQSYGVAEGGEGAIPLIHLTGRKAKSRQIATGRSELIEKIRENVSSLLKEKQQDFRLWDEKAATTRKLQPQDSQHATELKSQIEDYERRAEEALQVYGPLTRLLGELGSMIETLYFSTTDLKTFLEEQGLTPKHDVYRRIMDVVVPEQAPSELPGSLGSGQYGVHEMDTIAFIVESLNAGEIVTVGTREAITDPQNISQGVGKAGEVMVKGLAGGHEYTVLDYTPKEYKRGATVSVKLRNPWGEYGRKYVHKDQEVNVETGAPWEGEREAQNEGTFWIDLADLVAYFKLISYTHP